MRTYFRLTKPMYYIHYGWLIFSCYFVGHQSKVDLASGTNFQLFSRNDYLFLFPQFCEADGRRIHWTRIRLSIFLLLSGNQRKLSNKSLRSGGWQLALAHGVQNPSFKDNLTPHLFTSSMLLNKLFI